MMGRTSDEEGETSAKTCRSDDSSDRPLKKARYLWQIKGKYHLKKPEHEDGAKLYLADETKDGYTLHPIEMSHCESGKPGSDGGSADSTNNDVQKPEIACLPSPMVSAVVSPVESEDLNPLQLQKWQARQVARCFVDNTINRVLEDMGFIPLAPQPRQGHVLIAVQDKLYCHGGMSGTYLYDDLHVLDADGTWTSVSFSQQPSGRAAHGAAYHNRFIYIFGGLGNSGALNDMWRLCIDTMIWEEVVVSGSVPPRRLDFAFSLVELPEKFEKKSEDDSEEHGARVQADSGDGAEQHFPYLLLHGGMDETGHIYDDFYVMSLRSA